VAEANSPVSAESPSVAEADFVLVVKALHLEAEGWALPVLPEDCPEANAPRPRRPGLRRLRCHDPFKEVLPSTPMHSTEPSVETLCQEVFEPTALAEFMIVFSKCQQERAKPCARRKPY